MEGTVKIPLSEYNKDRDRLNELEKVASAQAYEISKMKREANGAIKHIIEVIFKKMSSCPAPVRHIDLEGIKLLGGEVFARVDPMEQVLIVWENELKDEA
jgi:hypothetical protein